VKKGQTSVITITIEGGSPGQHFGQINLAVSGQVPLHIPVAYNVTQGDITLTQSCAPGTIPKNGLSSCTITASNETFADSFVEITTTLTNGLNLQTPTTPAVFINDKTAKLTTTLDGAVAGDPDIAPGSLFGYLPLADFGVTPIEIGDEEIINFTVPEYIYGGLPYTSIGVVSNGYAVVGGGGGEDVECCPPQDLPDPARPNNVLAPFWTDTDGTGAPGIYAATLTDDVTGESWLVVEWQVVLFGTTTSEVFQLWIGLNGTEDITFAYDPANLPVEPPVGFGLTVGAENVTGSAGDDFHTAPTEDQRVSSVGGTPGESITYVLKVKGKQTGNQQVTSSMTASGVPGTTIVTSKIIVS
jgi:hypothetical protein